MPYRFITAAEPSGGHYALHAGRLRGMVRMIEIAHVDPDEPVQPEFQARYLSLLDSPEREKFDRYIHDQHRLEYLAGRALAKLRIAAALQIAPTSVRFRRNADGRLNLLDAPGFERVRFSISHTRGCAACAVSLQADLGLDVEHTGRDIRYLPISSKFFAESARSLFIVPAAPQRQ